MGGGGAGGVSSGGVRDGFQHCSRGVEVLRGDCDGGLDDLKRGRVRREEVGFGKRGAALVREAGGLAGLLDFRGRWWWLLLWWGEEEEEEEEGEGSHGEDDEDGSGEWGEDGVYRFRRFSDHGGEL